MKRTRGDGFTLIELMIVVAIIGILAAIALPKFTTLVNKSKEGATKGALSAVRSALHIYYGDTEGWFPADNLASLTLNGKYLSAIPVAKLPATRHQNSGSVMTVSRMLPGGQFDAASAAGGNGPETGAGGGGGGWAYFNDPAFPAFWGTFMVNCIHEDSAGQASPDIYRPWTAM